MKTTRKHKALLRLRIRPPSAPRNVAKASSKANAQNVASVDSSGFQGTKFKNAKPKQDTGLSKTSDNALTAKGNENRKILL